MLNDDNKFEGDLDIVVTPSRISVHAKTDGTYIVSCYVDLESKVQAVHIELDRTGMDLLAKTVAGIIKVATELN